MGSNQSIKVYAQLFDQEYIKDAAFYKILYTTPVHADALSSVLVANSEVIIKKKPVTSLKIIQEMFYNGLVLLNDAIVYPDHLQDEGDTGSRVVSVDGDDITDIKSGPSVNFDEDDITAMNGVRKSLDTTEEVSVKPTRQFEAIDDELRIELISNILIILQVLFNQIYEANKKVYKLKKDFNDLLIMIFNNDAFASIIPPDFLKSLVGKLNWYLLKVIIDIEKSQETVFTTLGLIKESLLLFNNVLKTLFLSITFHEMESPEFSYLKKCIAIFYDQETNLAIFFSKLLKLTNGLDPKIRLSPDSLIIVYSIIATLANVPNSLFKTIPHSSDITNVNHAANKYLTLIQSKQLENINNLIPIYCMELNYFYNYRPDILNNQIKNGSFFSWLTGNSFTDNLYSKFQIVQLPEEPNQFTQELVQILEKKRNRDDDDDILEAPELLSITLLISTCFKDPSYINNFTKQSQEIVHKIEDLDPHDNHIELFEIWLCTSSYIFQYQYKSLYFQFITKISLHLLIKALKQNIDNIRNYQINEFKWKLSHQKAPIVPNDLGKNGIKSSLCYVLDVLQNLLRFNLTNKLKIDNYQLALNCILMILQEFQRDNTIDISKYNWSGFHNTIINVLKFIKTQKLLGSKYFQSPEDNLTIKSITEEILQIVNYMLHPSFNTIVQSEDGSQDDSAVKSINYDLVYNILLNYDLIVETINDLQLDLPNLQACLAFYTSKIHLTEESKQEDTEKINLMDYDFDSPELTKLIVDYLKDDTHTQNQDLQYKLPGTFLYTKENVEISDSDMIKIINVMLIPQNKPLARFFHQVAK